MFCRRRRLSSLPAGTGRSCASIGLRFVRLCSDGQSCASADDPARTGRSLADHAAMMMQAMMMQAITRRYVGSVNARYRRTGTMWEGRFKSALVDSEHYALACYRSIERNPIRAGIVTSPREYRWSSHARNAHGTHEPLITPHAAYLSLAADDVTRVARPPVRQHGRAPHRSVAPAYAAAETLGQRAVPSTHRSARSALRGSQTTRPAQIQRGEMNLTLRFPRVFRC